MSAVSEWSIRKIIKKVVDPLLVQIRSAIVGMYATTIDDGNIQLRGDIVSTNTMSLDENTVVLDTRLNKLNHVHTTEDIPTSVTATSNTFVMRDGNGYIYSNGDGISSTGYSTSSNDDLIDIFKSVDEPFIDIQTNIRGSGDIITQAYLEKNTQTGVITLVVETVPFIPSKPL